METPHDLPSCTSVLTDREDGMAVWRLEDFLHATALS